MFEWMPITQGELDDRKMSVSILALLKEYQAAMKELVLEYIGRNVFLKDIDISRDIRTIPMTELINAVEENIKNLVGTDVTEEMLSTITWHGWLRDERRLDYTDVNRWFKTLQLLYQYLLTLHRHELQTGQWHTGEHLVYQTIGVI